MQGILILLGLIAIGLFGGNKGVGNNGLFSTGMTPEQKKTSIEIQITDTQNKIDELKKQVQIEEEKKNASVYKGMITLSYVNKSNDPTQEYLSIRANNNIDKKMVKVSGWTLKSLASGSVVSIPKGTYLFFTGIINPEEDIYLTSGETVYLVTGVSPVGISFKVNKCSGYMQQFQTFTPYINNR